MSDAAFPARILYPQARITAIGSYVPERRLTNADLERIVDTSDRWIVERTGIKERRICAPDEFTSDLCIAAVQNMKDRFQPDLSDVDLVLVSTSTPDFAFPSTAALVQAHFAILHAGTMDLSVACAGFVNGLLTAFGMVTAGFHRKIIVIGADALSKMTDYTDRSTCILFGDGAGAVLVERTDEPRPQPVVCVQGSDGDGGIHLYQTHTTGSMRGRPVTANGKIIQNGREVYKFAVQTIPRGVAAMLSAAGLAPADVDWFLPHSANLRIIESVCEKTGIPLNRTLHTIERYGNTSAATIPLAMDEGVRQGRFKAGDAMLLFGFGGGLVHTGMLMRWAGLGQ